MRKLFVLLFSVTLVSACGGGSGGDGFTPAPTVCSNDDQKQFVLDSLYDWYLWNEMLPANINIADYATPEALVVQVTETYGPQKPGGGPLDRFSSVGSLVADQQFFGEGKYEGFGFSWREENSDMRVRGVFPDSPADIAGLARGQTVITLNGRTYASIQASEGINAFFDVNETVTFEMRLLDDSTFSAEVTKDIVTIAPIPQWRTIDMGPGVLPVGYMELYTFVSTADPVFDQVFADFIAADVKDVIIDMRYNGGGLVSTAELLGDYLGGFNNDGQVFSNTEFNADRAAANNRIEYFEFRRSSIDLRRLIVIASRSTASASELVVNSLDPYLADGVYLVGDNSFGKPVGQIGLEFCEKILRPTSFKFTNAAGFGDYFDGLPVDCAATDDLDVPVGDDSDPNIMAALSYVAGTGCPVSASPSTQQKATGVPDKWMIDRSSAPQREFAGAY